jgi:hypothetical protein
VKFRESQDTTVLPLHWKRKAMQPILSTGLPGWKRGVGVEFTQWLMLIGSYMAFDINPNSFETNRILGWLLSLYTTFACNITASKTAIELLSISI